MLAAALNVPQLRIDAPSTAIVIQWGEVDGRVLRAGDRLVLGGARDGLVLLVPRGFGRPMLGRHTARGLVAEPGRVPASASRWGILSGVRAIERALERGAGMPEGRWSVAIVIEGGAALALPLSQLREDSLSADEVDARLRDALLTARQHGIDVRVGVSTDRCEAQALAETAAANHVRISMDVQGTPVEPAGHVIVGPWREVPGRRSQDPQRQLGLFDFGRRSG